MPPIPEQSEIEKLQAYIAKLKADLAAACDEGLRLMADHQSEVEQLTVQNKVLADDLAKAFAMGEKIIDKNDELTKRLAYQNETLQDAEDRAREDGRKIVQLQAQVTTDQAKLSSLAESNKKLEESSAVKAAELINLNKQSARLSELCTKSEESAAYLKNELEKLSKELERNKELWNRERLSFYYKINGLEETNSKLSSELENLANQPGTQVLPAEPVLINAEVQTTPRRLATDLESPSAILSAITTKMKEKIAEHESALATIEELKQKLAVLQASKDSSLAEYTKNIKRLESCIEHYKQQSQSLQQDLEATKSEATQLHQLEREHTHVTRQLKQAESKIEQLEATSNKESEQREKTLEERNELAAQLRVATLKLNAINTVRARRAAAAETMQPAQTQPEVETTLERVKSIIAQNTQLQATIKKREQEHVAETKKLEAQLSDAHEAVKTATSQRLEAQQALAAIPRPMHDREIQQATLLINTGTDAEIYNTKDAAIGTDVASNTDAGVQSQQTTESQTVHTPVTTLRAASNADLQAEVSIDVPSASTTNNTSQTLYNDWHQFQTLNKTPDDFYLKRNDAVGNNRILAQVRSGEHHNKEQLALEVFLSVYLAGYKSGYTPTVSANGSDPELLALFYANAKLFEQAGMPIIIKGDVPTDGKIQAAQLKMRKHIGESDSTISDVELGKKLVSISMAPKVDDDANLSQVLTNLGYQEQELDSKKTTVKNSGLYYTARNARKNTSTAVFDVLGLTEVKQLFETISSKRVHDGFDVLDFLVDNLRLRSGMQSVPAY